MKLSEMNTMELASALCRMAEPMERIGQDEAINAYFAKVAKEKKPKTQLATLAGMAGTLIPALLDTHRVDTLTILSAMTGKSVNELEMQSGMQTIRDARACFDGDFMDFFKSAAGTAADK